MDSTNHIRSNKHSKVFVIYSYFEDSYVPTLKTPYPLKQPLPAAVLHFYRVG